MHERQGVDFYRPIFENEPMLLRIYSMEFQGELQPSRVFQMYLNNFLQAQRREDIHRRRSI